jgi:hypothetical protein
MTSGHPLAGAVPDGYVIVEVNVIELALLIPPAVTESVLPEIEPLTIGGFGGRVPVSYACSSAIISLRRQSQSAAVTTLLPLAKVNGSGNALLLKLGTVNGAVEQAKNLINNVALDA